MKKKALLACLLASAPVNSQEIDELVNTSQSIRDSFKYGIQAVGGMLVYAPNGGIAPTGMVSAGYISEMQMQAYNDAMEAVQNQNYSYDAGAQEYFDSQAQQAMTAVDQAVSDYVAAAEVLVEVATINEMAQEAQSSGNEADALAIQEYAATNDVLLDDAERLAYNDSLDAIEETAQQAAAFYAVAGDATLIESANDAAESMLTYYSDASNSYFDSASGMVVVEWANQTSAVMLDVNGYFKTDVDIITAGSTSTFYNTSPEGGCWFIEDPTEREACMYGG